MLFGNLMTVFINRYQYYASKFKGNKLLHQYLHSFQVSWNIHPKQFLPWKMVLQFYILFETLNDNDSNSKHNNIVTLYYC